MSAVSTSSIHALPLGAQSPPQIRGWELLRATLAARLDRLTHWEFWPAWAIYLPLLPYIAWLAIRHRGLTVCTHANPGIPRGGIIGESKRDILRLLPADSIVPTQLLAPAPLEHRLESLALAIREQGWTWPIVLKPDVGERGTGVCLIADLSDARAYLAAEPRAVIAQRFHPGPFEAGVFYMRLPDQPRGRIFSITDKRFASVLGDGRSSIRTLIWRHPRYRMQARIYLAHLGERADTIPARDELIKLGFAGNHCRGAMFLDGAHLITPAVERAFDAIATRTPGFFFGRFDIRYSNEDEFRSGHGFQIVELNGLLSESTNIYDPGASFLHAQRILREQWRWAFAIGAKNHRL